MAQRTIFRFVFAVSFAVVMVSPQSAIAQWDNQPDGSQVTPDP
jgi:hypothetical protein